MDTEDQVTVVAEELANLLDAHPVLEGKVSPKRILDADGVRVVQLALGAGQELREHKVPVPIIIQTIAGAVTVSAAGRDVELNAGGLMHLAAGLPHAVVAQQDAQVLLFLLGGKLARAPHPAVDGA